MVFPGGSLMEDARPKSKFASWEDPPIEGEPFNYDAVPSRFFMDIESVGSMPPDEIMQQGIKYQQEKLAAVIKTFREEGDDGVRSPGQDYAMGGMGGGGYETPFGVGGAMGDNRTPYGGSGGFGQATPYGGSGWP